MKETIEKKVEDFPSPEMLRCTNHEGTVYGYKLYGKHLCTAISLGDCPFKGEYEKQDPFPVCYVEMYHVRIEE
jgi:hypothetical protein